MIETNEYHSIRHAINTSKKELGIAAILICTFFYLEIIHFNPIIIVVLGLVMGTWLAFRPSEWAVEGIESIAGHRGYTVYVAGMLSSLASNMPEAVISGLAAVDGYVLMQNPATKALGLQFLDIAVLSVLIAAGFNMLLLGITIVIATRGKGDIDVPEEAIKKDSVLIRWTIVALASMFALGIVDLVTEGTGNFFPREASFLLFLSYIIYAVALTKGEVTEGSELAKSEYSKKNSMILTLGGFIGIFLAGELLTSSVQTLLTEFSTEFAAVGDPVYLAALLLGAAGAIPEHGIAVVAAVKGKIGLAIGNLIGGVLQIVLLIFGGIGIFVLIPLDRYVLFQIVVIAGSLWFLKRNITDDHKLDMFEGLMIILLQAYVFILLIMTAIGYS